MTISTTTSSVTYIGNGATTLFSFPFVGVSSSDLQVIYTNTSGTETVLGPTQYTLVLNPPPSGGLWGIGGSVTYPISGTPIQIGTTLVIIRIVPFEQTVSISNQGAFYPQAVEQGLDLLELQIQQLATDAEYTIRVPIADPVPPNILPSAPQRANGFLAFDNNGQPIISGGSSGGSPSGSNTTRPVHISAPSTIGLFNSDAWGGISVYQSGSPVATVQLPVSGGPYPVFDGSLNAGTYPITILPPAGLLIQGTPSYRLVFNGQRVTFFYDGIQILIG